MVARAIHAASDRGEGAFVPVNCGAVPETLLESELYGHEKGAFTGAETQKRGRIETAAGGTLFLDEIGDLPAAAQVKLLRFLEDRIIERVGGTEPIHVDVRLIAATHVDLNERLRAGTFREDLYYRLNVVNIALPPLRERLEDVPLLVAHFLEASGAGAAALSEEALGVLRRHSWPGNVRELRAPRWLGRRGAKTASTTGCSTWWRSRSLALTGNNQVKASEMLGIHRTTLRKKMERYGLLKVKPRGDKNNGDGG
jgi:transcriptional regulator with PAS, ATPase and Fis domain